MPRPELPQKENLLRIVLSRLCYLGLIVSCLVFYLSGNVQAFDGLFDGKRKGFILGVSLQKIRLDSHSESNLDRGSYSIGLVSSDSFGLQIRTGYGFSERLLLYHTSRASQYGSFALGFN